MFEPHYRVSAIGEVGPLADLFSYGFSLRVVDVDGDPLALNGAWDISEDAWQDIADDIATFHGSVDARIGNLAVLKTIKIAAIGADGKYVEDPRIFPKNVAGNKVIDFAPGKSTWVTPQNALAVSLTTERRGPTGKGRFYLPLPGVIPDAENGWKVPVADAEAIRNAAQTMLNNVNNNPGFDLASPQVVVASTKGYNTPVTGVRVGRLVDTIRSRRNALGESYTAEVAVA